MSQHSNALEGSTLLQEAMKLPVLSPEEQVQLAILANSSAGAKSRRALDKLTQHNMRFIVGTSTRIAIGCGFPRDDHRVLDVVQAGLCGFARGVQKFDPTRKVYVLSYAVNWIKAYARLEAMKLASLIKLGTTQAARAVFWQRGIERPDLTTPAGRMTLGKLPLLSLNAPLAEDDGETYLDVLPGTELRPDEEAERRAQSQNVASDLQRALKGLSPRQREIVNLRYLRDHLTLDAVGERFGLSRERIRQIETQAIERMLQALGSSRTPVEFRAAMRSYGAAHASPGRGTRTVATPQRAAHTVHKT